MSIWLDPDDKVKTIKVEHGIKYVRASLLADTDTEVKAIGTSTANIEGFKGDEILTKGSDCFTMNKKYLTLNSNGEWS